MDPNDMACMAFEYAKLKARCNKKHVSIIVRNNNIEAIATNAFEVPERFAYRGYRSLHSEVAAFMKLSCPKDNLMLYNYRFNNQGSIRMAKPCSKCEPWVDALFDLCWYSNDNNDYELLK